jgi:hypothetical protein
MAKAALVGMDVEKGSRIVKILDDAGLQVKVALWAFLSEYDEWRLVLSSSKFDAESKGGYRLYYEALEAAGIGVEETPFTMILSTKDRFIRELRKKFAKAKRVEGARIYVQSIGDRFVDEGFLYRA